MAANVVQCLNMFPAPQGISRFMRPLPIVTGVRPPGYASLRLEFGSYVQLFQDNTPSNTIAARTLGAIALATLTTTTIFVASHRFPRLTSPVDCPSHYRHHHRPCRGSHLQREPTLASSLNGVQTSPLTPTTTIGTLPPPPAPTLMIPSTPPTTTLSITTN